MHTNVAAASGVASSPDTFMARLNGDRHELALRLFMVIVLAHWIEHLLQAVQRGAGGVGRDDALPNTKVFHAGTRWEDGKIYTSGGRILNVTARGTTLAEALERLARDPELRARMGRSGREKVLREFNLAVNAERLSCLFDGTTPASQALEPTRASA